MTPARALGAAALDDVLRAALKLAGGTVFADRVALYIAALTDPSGFALAVAVHARVKGPDPVKLRDRSLAGGVCEPLMVGAAPVEMLACIVEALPDVDADER